MSSRPHSTRAGARALHSSPPEKLTAAVTEPATQPGAKPSNPKDAVGIKKAPMSTVSSPVLMEAAIGMMEGALKYGRHNYRVIGVRGSVYYDATMRHLMAWWEGEDLDPDSGMSHIAKAITSLCVLRDAMIQNKFMDDRPPRAPDGWLEQLNKRAEALLKKYPDPVPAYTEKDYRRGNVSS